MGNQKSQNQLSKGTSTGSVQLSKEQARRRAMVLQTYSQDLITNTFGLAKLISESKPENIQKKIEIVKKYKIGMCITRPNFHTLKIFNTPKEKALILSSVMSLFTELNNWFKLNPDKKFSETDITEYSIMFMDQYMTWSLEDLMLFTSKAKKGDFGKVFDRFDAEVLNGWLSQYEERVSAVRTQANRDMGKQSIIPEELAGLKSHFKELYSNNKIPKEEQMDLDSDRSENKEEEFRKYRANFVSNSSSKKYDNEGNELN